MTLQFNPNFNPYAKFKKTGYIALTKNKDFVLVAIYNNPQRPTYHIAYLSDVQAVVKGNTIRKFCPILQGKPQVIQTISPKRRLA